MTTIFASLSDSEIRPFPYRNGYVMSRRSVTIQINEHTTRGVQEKVIEILNTEIVSAVQTSIVLGRGYDAIGRYARAHVQKK
jgi:hypothetical protein